MRRWGRAREPLFADEGQRNGGVDGFCKSSAAEFGLVTLIFRLYAIRLTLCNQIKNRIATTFSMNLRVYRTMPLALSWQRYRDRW
jgi:hypothetical protein